MSCIRKILRSQLIFAAGNPFISDNEEGATAAAVGGQSPKERLFRVFRLSSGGVHTASRSIQNSDLQATLLLCLEYGRFESAFGRAVP